ncbi:MAG: 50S ribosomal protein L22 [Flavobacteriales bacterium]|nr:50S ribosomal protein L22 [Flavobacteriales bacterium]
MEATAKLNNCPVSPRKMRLVADQIRGKKVEDALNILKFNQKPVYAAKMEKLLLSAMSNWKNATDGSGNEEECVVKEVYVNQGRTLKRIKPAPQGRAHRVRKRSNHITLVVSDNSVVDFEEVENETEE